MHPESLSSWLIALLCGQCLIWHKTHLFLLSFIFSDSFLFCFVLFAPSAFSPYLPGPYCAFVCAVFFICQTSYAVLLSEVLGKDVLSCLCSPGPCSCWSVSGCIV